MRSGVFWGYVGLIEGIIGRIQREIEDPAEVVTTGGLAPLFADSTTALTHVDPQLTLKGLLTIHRRNSET
jgi:type III pantothenate kinase